MAFRIEILAQNEDISFKDGRSIEIEHILRGQGISADVRIVDVYTSENDAVKASFFTDSVANPVTQNINARLDDFDWALEIGFLPGVTDNVGHTASELLALGGATNDNECYTSRLYLIKGDMKRADVENLAASLSNTLIQRNVIKSYDEFKAQGGMGAVIPKVQLDNQNAGADEVDLDIPDAMLEKLGKEGIANADGTRRGPLGLSLLYLKAIQAYFKKEGRKPTDIEIETLAQTWSEHCKHTIFASPIDEVKDGLYKHYIKRATMEIREERGDDDICVSVFSDNAGGIIFDDNYLITDKVETHNSPSALDPFGGAITGIVGVNRDCLGFGQGAKPVINRYGYCLADPRKAFRYFRDAKATMPILQPDTIMKGVVAGVEAGGNQSGIPTPQGFTVFDDRYVGKPLVFVGTIGLIPREINGKPGHVKKANPGDKIVMLGGRVGRDGIHGATFSSVALDEGSPATAVQIGDPITQKKFSDAIVKEVRDMGLYSAITDNGAGGLSSSVGEMAEQSGGFCLDLDLVPLKYPGMSPWEIWISESQERMTLAVPPENTDKLIAFFAKRGCEATVIGEYTDSGRAQINWHGETIMDMDMDFLHDGLPETPLVTSFTRGGEQEPEFPEPADYSALLCNMLERLNICSKEFIGTQYDHNVQGSAVLGPFQGKGRVMGDASITRPVFDSLKGVVLSQGLFPRYSDIDTGSMARSGLDMAVRSAVAAGADFFQLALLDNICWCSSDEPERLGQLKRAVEGIYNLARDYGTPFISGKDSMFNDFKGYDENGEPVKISAPPTLLTSSIGVIPDVMESISLAPKAVGDVVYVLGATHDECGGSEYYDLLGYTGNNVPDVDAEKARLLYKCYTKAARKRVIASAIPVGYGGLGAALAKMAIAGQMGMDINLADVAGDLRLDKLLFSETTGRIIVTVSPPRVKAFEKLFNRVYCKRIGHIAYTEKLNINNVLKVDIAALDEHYKKPLKDY
ncbi:MAG: phosphoribosylformylglycinamidine synthase [Micavibrio sp.]|nr:phosphoribosylformylglycinamidine synthase [Micavibrio sp.]